MEDLRYPIGKYDFTQEVPLEALPQLIADIANLPEQLIEVISKLSPEQLDTTYRAGGWTLRQVVHHIADSHMNAYVRFKLALTEDSPIIKPYDEAAWAELADNSLPVDLSLSMITALHTKWTFLFNSLKPQDFDRCFRHPEIGPLKLSQVVGIYAWHSKHHLAHISNTVNRLI